MVGTTGIEPVTPAMSMQCSPAELRSHYNSRYIALEVDYKPKKVLFFTVNYCSLSSYK